ncbi:hypothetical protein D3C77_537780 [compost metagenome]
MLGVDLGLLDIGDPGGVLTEGGLVDSNSLPKHLITSDSSLLFVSDGSRVAFDIGLELIQATDRCLLVGDHHPFKRA